MRILIIEDDRKIANAIKKGLEQESFACDLSYSGRDGLSSALTSEYDLIVLDRMLPETDGIKICRALRKEKHKVRIIMLTAKDGVEDRVEGLNSGADDYLVKPFAFQELLARIRALLRRPSNVLDNKLMFDDLTLNTLTFDVSRGSNEINLSTREFALLEHLMRNPNRILTKENIINHVWDYDADVLPNTVEVYIGYLRNKIDKPFLGKPELIHTVRGFGYKLSTK